MKIKAKRTKPFIVPTLYGLAFFLLILNVFALGYARFSPPFHTVGLTLIIFGLAAMIQTNNNLEGVSCDVIDSEPGHEGDLAKVTVMLRNSSSSSRYNLHLQAERRFRSIETTGIDSLQDSTRSTLILRCPQRGIYPLNRIKVYSRGYYGLFYTWKWLPTQAEVIVYPKPEGSLPLPSARHGHRGSWNQGEDFAGHKAFTPGASLKQVDWKAYARGQALLLKDFRAQSEGAVHLNFAETPGPNLESRLRQLSAWVVACHQQNRSFSLEMPGATLAEHTGREHTTAALRLLAAHKDTSL